MKTAVYILILWLMAFKTGYAQVPDEYLKTALENNPGLKASYREFEAALERIPQTKALSDPMLMAGYSVLPAESMAGMEKARLSLTQMFPWFGTLKARGDEAALQAEARYQNYLDQRNNLYFEVTAAWYPLYEIGRFRQLEKENIGILNSYKNIATQNFENGTGPMVDVLRSDIMLQDAQTRLLLLDDQEASLSAAFNNLLNRSPDEEVKIPDTLHIPDQVPGFNHDSLLLNNPRLEELNLLYQAGEINRKLTVKQGLPNIGLGLEYMRMVMQPEMDSPGRTRGALMPMVTLSLPIYRGKYKAAREEARLMQDGYALQRENTLNRLSSGFSRTLAELRQQQKMLDLFNRQVQTTRQSLNLLFRSYSNSGNNFEEVLRMQQQLLLYEKEQVSAQVELLVAQAEIHYLTAKNNQ